MTAPASAPPAMLRQCFCGDPPLFADRGIDFTARGVDTSMMRLSRENHMRILRSVLVSVFFVAAVGLGAPGPAVAQVGISVSIAPPLLPVYAQPPIPGPGYLWTPGYWAWGPFGYYWVPGTWVLPPAVGLLWTPGFWGWANGVYLFHAGFWGPTVGFYGGINYGFGYTGVGYAGGYWANGNFYYNRAVNNISNTRITNVYNRNVEVNRTTNVSFNGGPGGVQARPTQAELAAAHEAHVAPTADQVRHAQAAGSNSHLRAAVNRGNPPIAATARPGEFTGRGVVAARGAVPARPVTERAPHPAGQPEERRYVPPHERPAGPQGAAPERAAHQHAAVERAAPRHAAHAWAVRRQAPHAWTAPRHAWAAPRQAPHAAPRQAPHAAAAPRQARRGA
jgi:hypothetical protein